jgi:outer membrane protein assembly factor BamD
MLGQSYEHEADRARLFKDEAARARMVKEFDDQAAAAYERILTRYPVMDRAKDARERLEALRRPVPQATAEAIAQNKQEEESRRELGHFSRLMMNLHRRPDVSQASKVGEPTLVPPKETNATDVAHEAQRAMMAPAGGGPSTVTGQVIGTGAPAPNQPIPRSASAAPASDNSIPELKPMGDATQPVTQAPQPAPAQVNEAAGDSQSSATTASGSQQGSATSSTSSAHGSNEAQSSSKKKKKRKLWPF